MGLVSFPRSLPHAVNKYQLTTCCAPSAELLLVLVRQIKQDPVKGLRPKAERCQTSGNDGAAP